MIFEHFLICAARYSCEH